MKNWLRHPTTWAAVIVAALIGSIMTFSYIGGFVNPTGHLHNAPIGFVNEDAGASVAGTQLDAGKQIQPQLTAMGEKELDWQVFSSRADAESKLRDNKLWGAIVVPQSFSSDIAQIAMTGGTAPQAKLDVLTNEGAGMFQPSVFTDIRETAVATTSAEVNRQLVTLLDQTQTPITPDGALSLGAPVVAEITPVVELPAKAGRGIAPFYLAVMITLSGFLAASCVSITIDVQRGAERLELFGREIPFNVGDGGPWQLWLVKAPLTVLASALAAVLAVFTATGPLGMDVASLPKAYGLAVLGAVAIGLVSLVFVTLFGITGELLGVLFTTIFGVPSALGVYPSEAVPGFFRFVASWHPLRYLTDGMRSIAFFDASGAGLARGVIVLVIWLVAAALFGTLAARAIQPARATKSRRSPLHRATQAKPVTS